MAETEKKKKFFDKVKKRFPDHKVEIVRGDSSKQQGMVDDIVLIDSFWAGIEYKASKKARKQPNQDHFVEKLNGMSFGAFVYPENEEEVLDALEQAFTASRGARVSES